MLHPMSTTNGNSDVTPKSYSSVFYRRKNDSSELDPLGSARCYSAGNESGPSSHSAPSHPWRARRMSLDEPVRQPSLFLFQGLGKEVDNNIDDRHKPDQQRQPRSPGGRLASFLNSLFKQSGTKNKKKKKKKLGKSGDNGSGSMLQSSGKEYDNDPDRRRWRSSSASHFRSSSSTEVDSYSKSRAYSIGNFYCYGTRNNNYRSSPVSVTTPTKSFMDLRSTSDHRQLGASNKPISSIKDDMKTSSGLVSGKAISELKLSDNEERGSIGELYRKYYSNINNNKKNGSSKESMTVDQADQEDSDSSSDLFELQIGGESYFSSDLPVYETTTHPGSSHIP